jgi:hypothetical protein
MFPTTQLSGINPVSKIKLKGEKVKNWDSEKLLDFQKNINQERINNLIIELSRPGDDMTSGSINSIVENIF